MRLHEEGERLNGIVLGTSSILSSGIGGTGGEARFESVVDMIPLARASLGSPLLILAQHPI